MIPAYEFRVHKDKTKCRLINNIDNVEYVVDLPYKFNHNFWRLEHDDREVLTLARKLIKNAKEAQNDN